MYSVEDTTRGFQVPGGNETRGHRSTQPVQYLCCHGYQSKITLLYISIIDERFIKSQYVRQRFYLLLDELIY